MPNYPAQIDTNTTLPAVVDNVTHVMGAVYNRLREAVIAVEQELGVKPSGVYSTVRARLDSLETLLNKLKIGDGYFGGDIESISYPPNPIQMVVGIIGFPIAHGDIMIDNGYVLKWVSGTWVPTKLSQDDILPPFLVELSGGRFVEVGQSVAYPAFTATYQNPSLPYSATLNDSEGNSQDISSTPTSFHSDYSFTKMIFDHSVDFTVYATYNGVTKASTVSYIWGLKTYWGTDVPGQTGEAFIKSLAGYSVTDVLGTSFTVTAGVGNKIYFAYPSRYGLATFYVGGFEGGFTLVDTAISVNAYGHTEDYTLYESDNTGLGSTTVTVS